MFAGNSRLRNSDPYWDNVILYLTGNGANNSTNIVDSSSNKKNISRVGSVIISTAQSRFGGSSIFFPGSNAYLTVSSSSDFNLDTSNFTIEFWYYPIDRAVYAAILTFDGVDHPFAIYHGKVAQTLNPTASIGSNNLSWFLEGLTYGNVGNLQWHHLALTRSGDTFRSFLNGQAITTLTVPGSIGNAGNIRIGDNNDNSISGYIDSLRITRGVARYVANFTPSIYQQPAR